MLVVSVNIQTCRSRWQGLRLRRLAWFVARSGLRTKKVNFSLNDFLFSFSFFAGAFPSRKLQLFPSESPPAALSRARTRSNIYSTCQTQRGAKVPKILTLSHVWIVMSEMGRKAKVDVFCASVKVQITQKTV